MAEDPIVILAARRTPLGAFSRTSGANARTPGDHFEGSHLEQLLPNFEVFGFVRAQCCLSLPPSPTNAQGSPMS